MVSITPAYVYGILGGLLCGVLLFFGTVKMTQLW